MNRTTHRGIVGDSVSDVSSMTATTFSALLSQNQSTLSHSTARRASIIRRTGISANTRGAQIRADSTTPWRLAYPR